ncbi:MAG: TonB-dependent receptor [Bacteroidota bacterium]
MRRGELNDRPVIDLILESNTIDAEWVQPTKGRWSGSSGIQLFIQNSINRPGSNPVNFIPDYDVFNIGAFTIQSYEFGNNTLELGARFDFQSLSVADTIRDNFIYDNQISYKNATFTLGLQKRINRDITFFSNIGTAWRPPNAAELYSFGYHHSRFQYGLWRYDFQPNIFTPENQVFDQSVRPVSAEKGVKWVSGLELRKAKLDAEFIVYANQINDYIFLRPYGITINVRGTFPFFIYDQTDAFFFGSDWDLRYKHSQAISSEVKISYVHARDMKINQALIEIPPLNVHYEASFRKEALKFEFNVSYTARQWNAPPVKEPSSFQDGEAEVDRNEIFDFMSAPESFILFGGKVGYEKKKWSTEFRADNILNTSYRINTNRLRYFADAPGRNFSIALEYKF